MRLYKGDRIMQMVDKNQVESCLEAGWSRSKPEPEKVVEPENVTKPAKASKTIKIKTPKKK